MLPLDDRLQALQTTAPYLSRASLQRRLRRHGISRLPDVNGDKPRRFRFTPNPLGYYSPDLAEVHAAEGPFYLFEAISRTSKRSVDELHERAALRGAGDFLRHRTAAAHDYSAAPAIPATSFLTSLVPTDASPVVAPYDSGDNRSHGAEILDAP